MLDLQSPSAERGHNPRRVVTESGRPSSIVFDENDLLSPCVSHERLLKKIASLESARDTFG